MNEYWVTLLKVCPLIFAAGFVDSIAGGGGLISLPAYLLAGLPIHFAYGTNKFSSTFGTFFSTLRYLRNGQVYIASAVVSAAAALLGSHYGAKAALALDEKYLRYCLIILLPLIGAFVITHRKFGETDTAKELAKTKVIALSFIAGLGIGAYDGFFGPGTGTFLILVYTGVIGFNLITASGNAKVVNLASNIAALITFIIGGKVNFLIGIPAALFGIMGNWLGSGLAIKNGAKVIRPVFMGVLVLLFATIIKDLF